MPKRVPAAGRGAENPLGSGHGTPSACAKQTRPTAAIRGTSSASVFRGGGRRYKSSSTIRDGRSCERTTPSAAWCASIEPRSKEVCPGPRSRCISERRPTKRSASLPTTSQGTIQRSEGGRAAARRSRISTVPMTPPRRLLLVRDVTSGRIADQTIQSLFKFLQDRDRDRTRLLRTNWRDRGRTQPHRATCTTVRSRACRPRRSR